MLNLSSDYLNHLIRMQEKHLFGEASVHVMFYYNQLECFSLIIAEKKL